MSMEGEKVSQLQTAEKVNSRKSQNIQDFTTAVDMENETGGENQKMPMTMTVFCNELVSQLILSEEYSFLMQVCRRG